MADTEFTVFYAWQSDLPSSTNRSFIEGAIKGALKDIERTGAVEASPRFDKDTSGVPGMPDIANTILEKIRSADVFVADVSYVGAVSSGDSGTPEPIPNPNVMIELGYALSELGFGRIVCVFNRHSGSQDDLPFDLRNRRWPIAYELSKEADGDARATEKVKLRARLKDAILAIAEHQQSGERRGLEERLDAVESLIAGIGRTTSQNSMLLGRLSEQLQSATPSRDATLEDREAECLNLRSTLIDRVTSGKFEGLHFCQGMLVLTLCPISSDARPRPLEKDDEDLLSTGLWPLRAHSWDSRWHGDRFVTYSGPRERLDAVTELDQRGVVNAAGHGIVAIDRRRLPGTGEDGVLYVPSVGFEKDVIRAVQRYLGVLSRLGASGPWFCTLGLIGLTKSVLWVGARLAFGGRPFEGDSILPPAVEIAADTELDNPQAVARALRPALDYVWREHNYPESLNYGESGDWVGH